MSSIITTYWVEPTYYGTNSTGNIPTEAEVLLGIKVLVLTSSFVDIPVNIAITEYGWIAVDAVQTNGIYTEWMISEFNRANIGPTEFIKYAGDVTVDGSTYNIYMSTWKSQVTSIKLL